MLTARLQYTLLLLGASLAITPRQAALAQSAAAERGAEAGPGDSPSVTAAPGKGLTVTTPDKKFSLTLRTRMQLRETFAHVEGESTNEVQVKTLRFFAQGNVLDEKTKYVIQLAFGSKDYEKGDASPIFDAYLDFSHLRDASLRVGQFFVPFDRARTIREFALQFVDRQQVVRELTLDRDVGLMIYSQDFLGLGGTLGYNFFLGGGEGRHQFGGDELGPLVVGRVSVRPFGAFDDDQESDLERLPRPRLAVGFGAGYNHKTDRVQSTYGGTFTKGRVSYSHFAADAVFKYAGFSLLTEAVVRAPLKDFVEGAAEDGTVVREWGRQAGGFFGQAGYLFTPKLEVVARWDQLFTIDRTTDPDLLATIDQFGKQVGGGVNLYLNGHAFKIQADYAYAFGEVGDGRHTARLQLDASF